jgi:ketol-acid reductoisomerase
MAIRISYESDADSAVLADKTVVVLGYGNQGRAHALNLRDSGCRVLVGQRDGGANFNRAREDGFDPRPIEDVAPSADLLILALPDEAMGGIYTQQISPLMRPGAALGFIHGFAIRFEQIVAARDSDVVMVSPKGPGRLVRDAFLRGGGLPCLVAVHQDASGSARALALAWGRAIGGGRGGMIETSFAAECESDLFGEQAVLCGGVIELMKAAFDVLVEAGYPEELAYIECIHEVKQVVDLQYADGLAGMRRQISTTAAYGGLTVGPKLIDDAVRRRMREALREIRDGTFARRWVSECAMGRPNFRRLQDAEASHRSEPVGRRVRELAVGALPRGD